MKKNGFVTHVLGLGGKRAGRRTTKSVPFIKEIMPQAKRAYTMGRKGFRAKTHRANPAIYHRTGNHKYKVYHQGDRIKKGNWSTKRWNRAVKTDEKRNGSRYEHWEMKHGRRGSWNKKLSWR